VLDLGRVCLHLRITEDGKEHRVQYSIKVFGI